MQRIVVHFLAGENIFLSSESIQASSGSAQPCIQWEPWAVSPEIIVHGHEFNPSPPLLVWLRIGGALLHSLVCLNGMHKDNFTFSFLLLLLNIDVLQCVRTLI